LSSLALTTSSVTGDHANGQLGIGGASTTWGRSSSMPSPQSKATIPPPATTISSPEIPGSRNNNGPTAGHALAWPANLLTAGAWRLGKEFVNIAPMQTADEFNDIVFDNCETPSL
jgi:hypothetical protein